MNLACILSNFSSMDDWKWYEGCLNCTFEICASSPENKEELIGNITKLIDEKKVVNEGALNEYVTTNICCIDHLTGETHTWLA